MDVAVIFGSGLSGAALWLGRGYGRGVIGTTVPGHEDRIAMHTVDDLRVLVFGGRRHLYEGLTAREACDLVTVAHEHGCETIILTNACGGVDPHLPVGTPVLISDHLNLTGQNPLVGPQFVDMADAYSPRLRAIARSVRPGLHEAVYAQLAGPCYETPAEVAMLRAMGAGLVGMSTAIETIQARALGMEVLGISVIADAGGASVTHDEVLNVVERAAGEVGELIAGVIHHLAHETVSRSSVENSSQSQRGVM